MKLSIVFILLSSCYLSQAQLVNMESKRMQTDSIRFVLKSDLLFNYTDNNGDYVLQLTSNISTQSKSKNLKEIYFLVLNYQLVRTADRDFQNQWFGHARYNHKLSNILRLEAFLQNQNNTQLTIVRRSLAGAGFRLKFLDRKKTEAYFGNSYMYEIERIAASDDNLYNHRNSSYLSVNQTFEKINLSIIGTAYFQPLYSNFGNYRALCQLKMEMPLTKRISFSALHNYSYISFSSELRDDRISTINVGLTFSI